MPETMFKRLKDVKMAEDGKVKFDPASWEVIHFDEMKKGDFVLVDSDFQLDFDPGVYRLGPIVDDEYTMDKLVDV